MFCPSCKSEFREGFTRCSECSLDLVQELVPESKSESKPENPESVVVFTTSNLHEAHLVKGLLEANGINVFIVNDHICRLDLFLTNAVGGIKLVVDKKQESLAKQVLVDYRGGLDPSFGAASPWE